MENHYFGGKLLYSVDQLGRVIVPNPVANFVPEQNCVSPPPLPPHQSKMKWTDPSHDFRWFTFGYELGPSVVAALLWDRYGNWYITIGLGIGYSALALLEFPADIGVGVGGVVDRTGALWPNFILGEDDVERGIIGHTWTLDLFPLLGLELNYDPPLRAMQLKGEKFLDAFLIPELVGIGVSAPSASLSNTITFMIYDANTPNPWVSPWQGKNKGAFTSYFLPWWLLHAE
jgi:hypothetical protein